jgi:outer membrane protein TolC
MVARIIVSSRFVITVITAALFAHSAQAQNLLSLVVPEQRTIDVRDPSQLPPTPMPMIPTPPTVAQWEAQREPIMLSLNDAIRIALANSEVVRILTGVTATASGSTIYDTAIVNAGIDQQRAKFDPRLQVNNNFSRTETPNAVEDLLDPFQAAIRGLRTDDYNMNVGLSKPMVTGGTLNFGVNANPMRFNSDGFPLNPQTRSDAQLDFTQPLLQGGGIAANVASIVLARIDTERSYFQFKDNVQNMVRSVVAGYWSLVQARTEVWTRDQQVEQLQLAYDRSEAQFRVGRADRSPVAQAKAALSNAIATRIAARSAVLQREAALRNVLRLPPSSESEIIPTTPPVKERAEMSWEPLIELAAERRPDIIELKLILEADAQQLLIANNQALPQLNAVALYRWNGLEGETPTGDRLRSGPGEFADWGLGVNFSVPLGLRAERAAVRQRELIMARDRANIDQLMHQVTHDVALNLRNIEQYYEQFEAYTEARKAARENLEVQIAAERTGRVILLNVLDAINSWGNAVNAEVQSLLQYNSELATLEQQTGTILETHGVRFYEERFASIGPLGRLGPAREYPARLPPTPNADVYPQGDGPAENTFDLKDPLPRRHRQADPVAPGAEAIPAPGAATEPR